MTPAKATSAKQPRSQRDRFIEAAREAEASEDEAVFDENLRHLAEHKPKEDSEPQK